MITHQNPRGGEMLIGALGEFVSEWRPSVAQGRWFADDAFWGWTYAVVDDFGNLVRVPA